MNWIKVSGILGFLGVGIGAFGAHALKTRISPEMLEVFRIGTLYHSLHAGVLLCVSFYGRNARVNIQFGAICFTLGILLFSGSLYALAITGIKSLGAITPFGGLCFLTGWAWITFKLGAKTNSQKI